MQPEVIVIITLKCFQPIVFKKVLSPTNNLVIIIVIIIIIIIFTVFKDRKIR